MKKVALIDELFEPTIDLIFIIFHLPFLNGHITFRELEKADYRFFFTSFKRLQLLFVLFNCLAHMA